MKSNILKIAGLFAALTLGSKQVSAESFLERAKRTITGYAGAITDYASEMTDRAAQEVRGFDVYLGKKRRSFFGSSTDKTASQTAIAASKEPFAPTSGPLAAVPSIVVNPDFLEQGIHPAIQESLGSGSFPGPESLISPKPLTTDPAAPEIKKLGFFESLGLIKQGMIGLCAGPYSYLFATSALVNGVYTFGNMSNNQTAGSLSCALKQNTAKLAAIAASFCSAYTIFNKKQTQISPALANVATIISALSLIYSVRPNNMANRDNQTSLTASCENNWLMPAVAVYTLPMIIKSLLGLIS